MWETIGSLTQRSLKQGERPGRCRVCVSIWNTPGFLQDSGLFSNSIRRRTPGSRLIIQGCQALGVKTPDELADGFIALPPCLSSRFCSALAFGNSQKSDGALMAMEWFTCGSFHSLEFLLFFLREWSKRLNGGVWHERLPFRFCSVCHNIDGVGK